MRMNRNNREYENGCSSGISFGNLHSLYQTKKYESEMKRLVRTMRKNNKLFSQDEYDYICGVRDGLTSQVKQNQKCVKRR